MKREIEALPPEQASDLAALQNRTFSVDEVANGAASTEIEKPGLAEEIATLLIMFASMAKPILPSLATVYTKETTAAAGEAIAALCAKYGWAENGLMGEWGEEVAAAVVLVPLAIATFNGVKADISENKRSSSYIEMKKQADLVQHMNIAHNLDGQTIPDTGVTPQPSGLQGWQPPVAVPK